MVGVKAVSIEILVAIELEDGSMQTISTRVKSVTYQAAAGAAELRRIRIGIDAELLNRLDSGNTCILVVISSCIGRAIDQDIRRRGLGSINTKRIGATFTSGVLAREAIVALCHAGREVDELQRIPNIKRNALDKGGFDIEAAISILRAQFRGRRGHVYSLLHGARFQYQS